MRAWFGPGSSAPEIGFGDLKVKGEPRAAALAYMKRLADEGWQVEATMFRSVLPEIPPKPLEWCIVRAVRGEGDNRLIQASFELAPRPGQGRIHWARGQMPGVATAVAEPC